MSKSIHVKKKKKKVWAQLQKNLKRKQNLQLYFWAAAVTLKTNQGHTNQNVKLNRDDHHAKMKGS